MNSLLKKISMVVYSLCLLMAVPLSLQANIVQQGIPNDGSTGPKVPSGKGFGIPATTPPPAESKNPAVPQFGINYHGGPVMSIPSSTTVKNIPNIYYIYYGTWPTGSKAILNTFAEWIGGSFYFNINTSYTNAAGKHIVNDANFTHAPALDNYSRGHVITDADILTIVKSAISAGKLPFDSNGIYFVLTATDVNESSGFCTQFCGWHTFAPITKAGVTKNIKYSFVGNSASICPNSCIYAGNIQFSPNNNPGVDGMISVLAHELEETVTDPQLNAWWVTSGPMAGEENADMCAWTFGTIHCANPSTGSNCYNENINGKHYLIQMNWLNRSPGTNMCRQGL